MKIPLGLSLTATLFIKLVFAWNVVGAEKEESVRKATIAPPYTIEAYDPKRNPADDLKMTVAKAKSEGKRILIQVGGDWCGWCRLMHRYFQENEKIAAALAKDFLIMKVNKSPENDNQAFLSKYPKVAGYPHIFVLDSDGTLLHSQDTAALEKDKQGYSEKAMLDFLAKWALEKLADQRPTPTSSLPVPRGDKLHHEQSLPSAIRQA